MTLPALVGILLAGLLQDPEIPRLIAQLDDDDIAVREQAAERLLHLGPPAEAALKEALARRPEPEFQARARSLLGEIRLAQKRDAVFGAAYRVSLPPGEHRVDEIARRVKEETGVALKLPADVGPSVVTLGADRLPFWEFLDRLSRAHGGLAMPLDQAQDSVALGPGKPPSGPVWYSGQFRVWIDRLRIEQRNPAGAPWDRASVVVAVTWQPNVHPVEGSAAVTLEEIVTDDGTKLAIGRDFGPPYNSWMGGSSHPRLQREWVTFEAPKDGVKRLRTLRGTARVMLPLEVETLSFEKPLESAGQVRRIGNFAITLVKCERKGQAVVGAVRIALPEGRPETAHDSHLRLSHRFAWRDVVFVDGDKKEVQNDGGNSSTSQGGGEETLERGFVFKSESDPALLRIKFLADYFDKRIEFQFSDVDLP